MTTHDEGQLLQALMQAAQQIANESLLLSFLHNFAHGIHGLTLTLQTARRQVDKKPDKMFASLNSALQLAEELEAELMQIQRHSRQLRRIHPSNDRCKVDAVVANATRLVANQARVRFNIAVKPHVVYISANDLTTILLNAIFNAAAAHASHVDISTTTDLAKSEKTATLIIADDGIGMPMEVLKNACKPFFTTRPSATGLGLFVVEQLLARRGGRLTLKSTHRIGTTLQITLPIATESEDGDF